DWSDGRPVPVRFPRIGEAEVERLYAVQLRAPSFRLRSPDHNCAPEREAARTHVREAGDPPRVQQPLLRPAAVEAADARPEESADIPPVAGKEAAIEGQSDGWVEPPEWVPDPARDREIE